jgi:hypothetical protein
VLIDTTSRVIVQIQIQNWRQPVFPPSQGFPTG